MGQAEPNLWWNADNRNRETVKQGKIYRADKKVSQEEENSVYAEKRNTLGETAHGALEEGGATDFQNHTRTELASVPVHT